MSKMSDKPQHPEPEPEPDDTFEPYGPAPSDEVASDELLVRLRRFHPERDPQRGGKG